MRAELPAAAPAALAASATLERMIAAEITACGGWVSFARYMELALYAPGLGYYTGGTHKFGDVASGGDFITAPELTPLFGQTLARQVAQVLAASSPCIIEAGAGSGQLAVDLLRALESLGALPERYAILELSGELRARQQTTLAQEVPHLADRVVWLDELPEKFSGCLVGNEVLDALPTHRVRWDADGLFEGGVTLDAADHLAPAERPATGALLAAAQSLPVTAPYRSEISLATRAWVAELARRLECGALLLLDYGLPQRELYHPQRDGGTVRCHYRHRVHDDPLWLPGLSDITSHVDFTAVAEAAFDVGLSVLGYTSQAQFLINCGIGEQLLARKAGAGGTPKIGAGGTPDDLKAHGAVNVLLSPNEMGELFKVIALGRGLSTPLIGFARGDRTHAL